MLDQTNLTDLLQDRSLLISQGLVGGDWVPADSKETFVVTNPARGDVLAQVPDMGRAETARAIEAAYAA
ncbi:MAG: succinate-semialdehyde dehydrogenase (NADP(+)), partial [Pseudomonadota bacterium]